jgi:PKD repeat protein
MGSIEGLSRGGSARWLAAFVATGLAVLGLQAATATSARADTNPDPGVLPTVSADALPTWQIDGVVWNQAVAGNTVYAVGSFTAARPPGTAAGDPASVPAANVFAYDITTGNRVASFNHQLNGQANAVAVSPDGGTVYIGGDFTTVDGVVRNHIAAFSTATNQLSTTFAAGVSGHVGALAVTGSTVYVGGNFLSSGAATRNRLAAFNRSNGALLSWAPDAEGGDIEAMVLAPDSSRVIVGGQMTSLNGVSAFGMGSVDASTGATMPWAATNIIKDGSPNGAIDTLSTDGTSIFGAGYAFGSGSSFEGTFSADPYTGAVNWLNDCHGDTYSAFPIGQVLYAVSHEHDCSPIGSFPDTNPRVWHRATAFTTYATGVNTGPDTYGWNFAGIKDSTILHWYPTIPPGTYTGQSQGAWSATGNASYVALGGEFPSVNGVAQQGLVRFAVRSIAPNKVAPVPSANLNPTAVSTAPGVVHVSWTATWDYDNQTLHYDVIRDGVTTSFPYSKDQKSSFWQQPPMGFDDTGLAPGSTHTYKIRVTDPLGNKIGGAQIATVTVASAGASTYAQTVRSDGASDYWRLGEPSGSAVDWTGFANATVNTGVTRGVAGAIIGDTDAATSFNGSTSGFAVSQTQLPTTQALSVEAWVNTTTTSGGKIVGYGNSLTGNSSSYDRHLYMDNSGHIIWGVYNGASKTLTTSARCNDGQWHHIVGVLDPVQGTSLFVDGKKVGRDPTVVSAQTYAGYWRIGGDNLSSWPSKPTSNYLNGTIDDVAIYPSALTAVQVQAHYTASGRTVAGTPAPTDAYGSQIVAGSPDLYWRLGESSGSTASDSGPVGNDATYSGGVTLGVAGAVTGTTNTAATFNGTNAAAISKSSFAAPNRYSEEVWFKTTTTQGGKLIGFGNASSGLSSSSTSDRHIFMRNDGRLVFGVLSGGQTSITSASSYNDGQWHMAAATQGTSGMALYVDGVQVATGSATAAGNYTGYWRVGGDRVWTGATSNYFAGSLDEAAVFPGALSAAQVSAQYLLGRNGNRPPKASFTSGCQKLACTVDASSSSDPDGTLTSYAWAFGDGSTATGTTASHTYAAAGTYTVTLTVTDNGGSSAQSAASLVTTANQPPGALFSKSCSLLACSFDGTLSYDPDGIVTGWSWSFGDGGTASGSNPSHTYANDGTYPVTLTVTDSDGATASQTVQVTVAQAPNQLPTAAFSVSCTKLVCSVDGTGSFDPDGTLVSYAWTFGDGGTATGATASHTYGAAGPYSVTLTVTDNRGGTGSSSQTANAVANVAPTAAFSVSCTRWTCSFDGTGSTDSDGTITAYAWNFGDGATGSGSTTSHTYATAGTYQASLTVTDNDTATGSVTKAASPPGNALPVAAFTVTCGKFACSFDATGSTDSDGTVSAYAWDFGDGSTGSGATASHPYAGTGPYTVTLTVTDNDGATGTATHAAAPVGNVAPTAAFTVTCGKFACSFDATGSTDSDGTVSAYAWDFGDGSTGSGATASHPYAGTGPYTVTLTVTDNDGATGTATHSAAPVGNVAPVAAFSSQCSQFTCTVDGSASSDSDGTVAGYAWDFGDGSTGSGVTAPHTYQSTGTYTITLTVTDNDGTTGTVQHSVTVTGDIAPTAAFTISCTRITCSFDGTGSNDPDGSIVSYQWDFGDASTGTGATATHTYAAAGSYTVRLTVTDNGNATGTVTNVAQPTPDQPPVAAFTSSCNQRVCSVDGTGSSDPDGSVASYAWTFGDGGTATGATASHTYAAPGSYTVTLTVTDDNGVTNNVSHAVQATVLFGVDAFGRTLTNAWGTADTGGAWTLSSTASNYAVTGGVGTIKMPAAGSGPSVYLNSVSTTTMDERVTISVDKPATGTGIFLSEIGRRIAGVGDYRGKVRILSTGAVGVSFTWANSAGAETTIKPEVTVPGLTYNVGDQLRVRLQVFGTSPTTLQLKVWKVGTTEPASWQLVATDSTAQLQVPGAIGLMTYLAGSATNAPVTTSYDDFWAGWAG